MPHLNAFIHCLLSHFAIRGPLATSDCDEIILAHCDNMIPRN